MWSISWDCISQSRCWKNGLLVRGGEGLRHLCSHHRVLSWHCCCMYWHFLLPWVSLTISSPSPSSPTSASSFLKIMLMHLVWLRASLCGWFCLFLHWFTFVLRCSYSFFSYLQVSSFKEDISGNLNANSPLHLSKYSGCPVEHGKTAWTSYLCLATQLFFTLGKAMIGSGLLGNIYWVDVQMIWW